MTQRAQETFGWDWDWDLESQRRWRRYGQVTTLQWTLKWDCLKHCYVLWLPMGVKVGSRRKQMNLVQKHLKRKDYDIP